MIAGYVVMGRYEGAEEFIPMLYQDGFVWGYMEVTVFRSTHRARKAIQKSIKKRLDRFGKDDIEFRVVRLYAEDV